MNVTPFDIKNIADECFGGPQTVNNNTYWSHDQVKLKNAYMLFYERVKKNSCPPQLISNSFLQHIRAKNAQLIRDQQLFDVEYCNFMYDIIFQLSSSVQPGGPSSNDQTKDQQPQNETKGPSNDQTLLSKEIIQLATYFVFETYFRIKKMDGFLKWMSLLKRMYELNPPMCGWLLNLLTTDRRSWFRYLLIECYEDYVRVQFSDLLHIALKTLGSLEYPFYLEKIQHTTFSGELIYKVNDKLFFVFLKKYSVVNLC